MATDVGIATAAEGQQASVGAPGSKGLKGGALGLVSSVVIGVARTAPAYSFASSLGLLAVDVGFRAPAVIHRSDRPSLLVPPRPGDRPD